jgi:hypothetical protein
VQIEDKKSVVLRGAAVITEYPCRGGSIIAVPARYRAGTRNEGMNGLRVRRRRDIGWKNNE